MRRSMASPAAVDVLWLQAELRRLRADNENLKQEVKWCAKVTQIGGLEGDMNHTRRVTGMFSYSLLHNIRHNDG